MDKEETEDYCIIISDGEDSSEFLNVMEARNAVFLEATAPSSDVGVIEREDKPMSNTHNSDEATGSTLATYPGPTTINVSARTESRSLGVRIEEGQRSPLRPLSTAAASHHHINDESDLIQRPEPVRIDLSESSSKIYSNSHSHLGNDRQERNCSNDDLTFAKTTDVNTNGRGTDLKVSGGGDVRSEFKTEPRSNNRVNISRHQPTNLGEQRNNQVIEIQDSDKESQCDPVPNVPSISAATLATQDSLPASSGSLTYLQEEERVSVRASVLSEVLRFAAVGYKVLCTGVEDAQLDEKNLYRLLTSFEKTSDVHPPSSQSEGVIPNEQQQQTVISCNKSLGVSNVPSSEGSSASSTKEEILEIHSPLSSLKRPHIQDSLETPRRKKLRLTKRSRASWSERNESGFNSFSIAGSDDTGTSSSTLDLTRESVNEESFNDESETPVPHHTQNLSSLRKRLDSHILSSDAGPAQPARMMEKLLPENGKHSQPNEDLCLNNGGVPLVPPSLSEPSVSGTTTPTSLFAESATSGAYNLINLITEELSPEVVALMEDEYANASSVQSQCSAPTSATSDHYSSDQDYSSDRSMDPGLCTPISSSSSTSGQVRRKRKRQRCGQCENCLIPDCHNCIYCQDKKRYHSVCKNKKSKPCLKWIEEDPSLAGGPPPNHPPSLKHLRLLSEASQGSQSNTDSDDETDEIFHTRLDRALREGYVEIYTAKCGVSGPPGTGKSHFRALISSKDRPTCRQSTALATEADQIIPTACVTHDFEEEMIEFHRNKSKSGVKWLIVSSKKLSQLIAKTIHNQNKGGRNSTAESSIVASEMNLPRQTMSAIRKKIKRNLKTLSKCKRKPKCLNKMKLLLLVDTGGQSQFQEIMPIFVRNSSVTLLVHKLNESLDDCPRFDYEINSVRYSVPEEMLVTNREYLEQSLRTICSCTFSRNISSRASAVIPKPHFAIIGMFKDQCSERMLKEKNAAVNECIRPFTQSRRCVPLTPSRYVDNPVFAIDGSEQGWTKNSEAIEDLHTHIERVTEGLGVKIPIRWFLFLHWLKEQAKKKSFLSLKECYEDAAREDLMMDKEDVDKALVLFDELNLILYFSDLLHDVVFCSPEFLFNKVSEIIAQSFDCAETTNGLTRRERREFHSTGIFTRHLLERVRSLRSGFNQEIFNIDHLLGLLKKLCIIAEISHNQFFIPCVLPLQRKRDDSVLLFEIQQSMCGIGIKPLVISFPDGYSPRGLFCASIAHLAFLSNWIVESPSCKLERKRNLIEFELREHTRNDSEVQCAAPLGRIIITDMVSHIEVYSTCNQEHLCDIRRDIYGALWHASKSLSYSPKDMQVNVGFSCEINCGICEPHGTAVSFNQKTRRWSSKCIKNSSKRARELTHQQMPWFASEMSSTLSGPSTSLLELMNEVATQTNKWESIALELELSLTDIERIKYEEQGRIQDCFRRILANGKQE